MHPRYARRPSALVLACSAFLLAGCGAADLYEAPESPFHVIGRVPLPSANEGVAALDDWAFVAGGEAGLHVIDVSTPGAPVLVATLNTTKYAESVSIVRTFAHQTLQDVALVVEGTEGITSYDVTDPRHVVSFDQGTTAVDGNRLFVQEPADPDEPYVVYLAESWKGVRIFESNPDFPGLLEYDGVFAGTNGYAMGIDVVDGWAYVADDEMGLAVVDARERQLGQVVLVSWADTPGNALDVDVVDGYAYVADGVEGLAVFRVNGPDTPVKVAQLDLTAYSRALVVRNGWALLCAADGGVHVVDVHDPEHPVYAGTVETGYAADVCVAPSGHVLVADRVDGLLVLAGPELAEDARAPAAVTTLAGAAQSSSVVRLTWKAVGDDGYYGTAAAWLLRRSDAPILDEADWEAAAPVADPPAPAPAGATQTFDVAGLTQETTWHFCLRALDDAGHLSGLSNDCAVTTPAGTFLRDGVVTPAAGTADETFRFEVTYLDAANAAPAAHDVVIDGEPAAMTLVEGEPQTGALYRCETTLAVGAHMHFFRFEDAVGNVVATDPVAAPLVGADGFTMGSPAGETGRRGDETQHRVLFSHGVEAAATEVTQAQWSALMPSNPSAFVGDELPVQNVSWYDALAYCNALSTSQGLTPAYAVDGTHVDWNRDADGWRLPTEAEWEFLCRAGTTSALWNGDLTEQQCGPDAALEAVGWYCGNATDGPRAVGQLAANALDLLDVHGNVREWCWDWYGPYPEAAGIDPAGPDDGDVKVVRGGSWHYYARECRSAARGTFYPGSADDYVGFRVVRNAAARWRRSGQ